MLGRMLDVVRRRSVGRFEAPHGHAIASTQIGRRDAAMETEETTELTEKSNKNGHAYGDMADFAAR